MKAPPVIGISSVWLIVGAVVSAAVLLVLFLFNPAQHGFYPQCFLKATTGLECAGCGGLRAVHQLLHGNWKVAFDLNPLLFLAAPILGLLFLNLAAQTLKGKLLFHGKLMTVLLWTLLTLAVVFTIWRNLR